VGVVVVVLTDSVVNDLIASEHRPRLVVEVMSECLVNVLAKPVDVTRRQTSGQRQVLTGHHRSTDTGVPSVQQNTYWAVQVNNLLPTVAMVTSFTTKASCARPG